MPSVVGPTYRSLFNSLDFSNRLIVGGPSEMIRRLPDGSAQISAYEEGGVLR